MEQFAGSREKNAETVVYLQALEESMKQKETTMSEILRLTKHQEAGLSDEKLDLDQFMKLLDAKQQQIDRLGELDRGFELFYEKIRVELQKNRGLYKDSILSLQKMITQITESGMKLKALEEKNKVRLEFHLRSRKKEIRDYKVNSSTAAKYYKNMANQYQGQAVFLDKKK